MSQRLTVTLEFGNGAAPVPVGRLGRDPSNRTTVLEWDADFAARGLPLMPLGQGYSGLLRPDGQRGATLPGLFEDSLPDGWGRLLLDRELAARGTSRAAIGDLERLAFVGRHGAGALTYLPEAAGDASAEIDLRWFEEIIPHVEDGASAEDLARLRKISGGSQGARPKFVAQMKGSQLRSHRLPPDPGWRHVLIKARAASDPRGSVEAELAYGAAMRQAGIDSSPMKRLDGAREAFFVTDRFDRPGAGRLHLSTIAGLLDCGMAYGAVDYGDVMKLTRILCQDMGAVEQMFRRMVFNVRAMNRDDHLRNHGFVMDSNGQWALAPAYDVSFSEGPGGEQSLAVAGEGRRPGAAAIASVAKAAGIRRARASKVINEVDAALADWPRLAALHEVPGALAEEIGTAIREARGWP
ncbi:toxin HipA [Salipiger pallidus]|uniref:Toxin HipA n=1 Tax=Salipiger pallidus TaxID=1775170 RepID=A0A8J2ZNK9_9RHOB|nr:type II toxin-antitoxin system HipA family toxin [Salipiger pallidus]GGG85178.1 toxin HipA [Salipiger pallidus]